MDEAQMAAQQLRW